MSNEKFWFEETQGSCHEAVMSTAKSLMVRQAYRIQENMSNYMLYANGSYFNAASKDYVHSSLNKKLYINLVQQIVSTLTSKIARNKPKPTFLTNEGDWDEQEQAKKLDRFMIGQFYKSKVYEETAKEFALAAIFGTGFIHIFREDKECKIESVHPDEIIADDRESLSGAPRNLYRVKNISKILLISQFPEYEEAIKESNKVRQYGHYSGDAINDDIVTIVEAWHLPDYKGKNGRHTICVEGVTLVDEEWKRDYFPFAKFKFQDRATGFYGRGVSELIMGIQIELNKIFERVQRNIHLTTVPRVLYEYSSKIVKNHFNNEIGAMVGYVGTAPQFITPSGVAPELFQWIQMLIEFGFREIGVSEMSAASQKPAGLNSGAAIREFSDIESDRFSNLQQRWETHHLDITDQIIDTVSEIAEDLGDYAVLSAEKEGALKIRWQDVKMDKESYVMQVYPTSLLPTHPSGRLATVQEMASGGLIDRIDALDLLDYPDLKKYISFETAPKDDIMATISSLLKGKYETPEPFQDLQNGTKLMQFAYLHYKHKGVKEEKLELFRRWMSDAMTLAVPPQPPVQPQQGQGIDMTQAGSGLEGTSMQGQQTQPIM